MINPSSEQKRREIANKRRALLDMRLRDEGIKELASQSIRPRDPQTRPVPSFSQRSLWFLNQLEPESGLYNITHAYRLSGKLDILVLRRSLNAMLRRHESLRTTFGIIKDEVIIQLTDAQESELEIYDLRSLPEVEREIRAREITRQQAQRAFNLARGPLLRTMVILINNQMQILIIQMHHSISDAWSMSIFSKELSQIYTACMQGLAFSLPELPVQYPDFALWQRSRLQGAYLQQQIDYWKNQLQDSPALLQLSGSKPRPAVLDHWGAWINSTLPRELVRNLKLLSQRTECTMFMILLAAFAVLLARYSGQDDIVIGSPIAGRTLAEEETLIGFFTNTLVLRIKLHSQDSVLDLLQQVRETTLEAYTHQDIPFEKLVDALQPERRLNYNPLFQVLLAFQSAPACDLSFAHLQVEPYEIGQQQTRFDLAWYVDAHEEDLTITAGYSLELFDTALIEQMVQHMETLLWSMATNPEQRCADLKLISSAESLHLLKERNQVTRVERPGLLIQQIITQMSTEKPDLPALAMGELTLTYAELNRQANQLAHYLQGQGVGPEVRVGLLVERAPETIIALLAILKAGGAFLPLDQSYPLKRLQMLLDDAQVRLVIGRKTPASSLDSQRYDLICLEEISEMLARLPETDPISMVAEANLAYIIYTSGSTGRPKGVTIEHRQIISYLASILAKLRPEPAATFALTTTLAADLGNTILWSALCTGGCLHILTREQVEDPIAMSAYLHWHPIDYIKMVPTHLNALLSISEASVPLPQQALILGGEATTSDLLQRIQQLAPACCILNHYGPTETTVGVLTRQVEANETCPLPLGQPLNHVRIYVLDQHLQAVPIGIAGEIYIGGAGVARGYWQNPVSSAERFLPDPFSNEAGARMYRSGDIALYRSNGDLYFLGRADFQVKIHGYRVELAEIEARLRQHPQIKDCLVLAHAETTGIYQLLAYIVPQTGQQPEEQELRSYSTQYLPGYMVPASFLFLEKMPLTANGKVDRHALPLPDPDGNKASTRSFVAPRTASEQQLTTIWSEVLHKEHIGIHDNYFSLGGDSILSIMIIARARRAGLYLTAKDMLQFQTIAELAPRIKREIVSEAEQGLVNGPVPLTPIQHWLFEQNLPEVQHHNQSLFVHIAEPLDSELLNIAFEYLITHHDALRLHFTRKNQIWKQTGGEPSEARVAFRTVDLALIDKQDQRTIMEEQARQAQQSLNLSGGPLIQARLFKAGSAEDQYLLIIIHHLIVDGVSWRLLLEDLQSIYRQLSQRQEVHLPAKTTSFRSWAQQLADYALTAQAEQEAEYWLQELARPFEAFPLDHPKCPNLMSTERTITCQLSHEQTYRLLQDVPARYRSGMNDGLLAALGMAYRAWNGQNILAITLEGHGREELFKQVDLSRTVGWFTSHFPVVLDLGGLQEPAAIIMAVKEHLNAIPHHGIGFGILRYLGRPEIRERLKATPVPGIKFNYLGQFDQSFTEGALFQRSAEEITGPDVSSRGSRPYIVEVDCSVINGQFNHNWRYSANLHNRETIERLAHCFQQALQQISTPDEHMGEMHFSASDFPLADLDEEQLGTLASMMADDNE
ncbi:amino acid adenylation domain-containing protein [Ktedonosporobacter rubrisoli]|uniref:Amino acid adenylation domain-containing protein n=1 Tax=Ktedonosporobacter rubrisoli TaxID=2509675 RepID=A0A4P6JPU5_KTERU|nr:non-ribosomal peptide synthetase [Ktedonosporobacter rubrisoli]QBD77253.1 amino acid adenylation domain-containing protein [Ktedonosporobacter rubrisoli]